MVLVRLFLENARKNKKVFSENTNKMLWIKQSAKTRKIEQISEAYQMKRKERGSRKQPQTRASQLQGWKNNGGSKRGRRNLNSKVVDSK